MKAYLLKGELKYTPKDVGEPYYIYNMGTFFIGIEEESLADRIIKLFTSRYLDYDQIVKEVPSGEEELKDVLGKLVDMGLLLSSTGGGTKEVIKSLLDEVSFSPKKDSENKVYAYIKNNWASNGAYQTAFITKATLKAFLKWNENKLTEELFALLNNGNLIPLDKKPRYRVDGYTDVSKIPFIVYTEKGKEDEAYSNIFKTEVSYEA